MDAFFAAVEERDNPRLRGLPVVVGADPADGHGRGVVSTANYKAREYGIHSAMPISIAWLLSEKAKMAGNPPAVFVSVSFGKYGKVSNEIVEIVRQHAPLVEQASVDEAYMDLSFCRTYATAKALCEKIKKEIKEKERLTASIGIGPNKLVAKIASDAQKPDGLTVVAPKNVAAFLDPLSVRKIPGIGPKSEEALNASGVKTVSDLKKFSRESLVAMFGKWGGDMYEKARGLDDSPVSEEYEAKSIGEQETFMSDTRDYNFITERLTALCESVIRRFKQSDFKTYKTVGITVRFSDFETKTRAHTLPAPANDLATLRFEATRLILPFLDKRENPRGKLIRLIGVKIEKLR